MKKISSLIVLTVCCLLFNPSFAQLKMPQLSSAQTMTQEFGLGTITVKYSRPNVKGRNVFSDLAPFGEVWRTGANTITTIAFSEDITLEGKAVSAGEYALLTVPGKDSWTIILNKGTKQWGAYAYKEADDVLRFTVKPSKLSEKAETMTMTFSDVMPTSAKLNLMWADTKVSIGMLTEVDSKVMANIDEAMKGEKKPYMQSAIYYYENGKDLAKALAWMNAISPEEQKTPWYNYWKAKIQLKSGDKAGAKASAKTGIEIAKAMNIAEYIRLNSAVLAQASK
ncbi:DUF2911 domain-containing protein [Daejeonella sp.]|uniref:DUF2911 domain-containing protein n=1 Tax=Daejeonella sp. TaxID=2805397 RepID=UPI0030BB390F